MQLCPFPRIECGINQHTTMADIQHLATLTEEDIKFRYITPAIEQAGWQKNQIRMEYFFTDGRIISAGSEYERASRKKADYVLQLNNDNLLAVVEAKSATKDLTTGLQQAIGYAEILDVPFAFASNGIAFREHETLVRREAAERETTGSARSAVPL